MLSPHGAPGTLLKSISREALLLDRLLRLDLELRRLRFSPFVKPLFDDEDLTGLSKWSGVIVLTYSDSMTQASE